MSAPAITIEANCKARQAVALLRKHGIRHLPVLDRGHLVGMLSERDLIALRDPVGEVMAGDPLDAAVAGLCSRELVVVTPDDDLRVAVDRMLEHGVGALPVVHPATGAVTAVVSYVDVLSALRPRL